jgi:ACS family hexuronate transporter-like MFS transporter
LRAALDSLPRDRQSRGIAISYSGGSLGAILAPVLVTPVAAQFGWRAAFLVTGVLGAAWLVLWSFIAHPPYLPVSVRKSHKILWPNLFERRFWALVASYGLGAIAIGPILYLAPLYLNRALGLAQADLGKVLWIPPLGWEIGYFFWGWAADRWASAPPVRLFVLLTAMGLPLAFTTHLVAAPAVLAIFFWTMFVSGGTLVLSLRTAALTYPREQTALVAGIGAGAWSAMVAALLPVLGRWFDQQRYTTAFVFVSLIPLAGTALWWLFTPKRAGTARSPVIE